MKILEQTLTGDEVRQLVDRRLEVVTLNYNHHKAHGDKMQTEVYAEVKWQLAELKMQLVDTLLEKLSK